MQVTKSAKFTYKGIQFEASLIDGYGIEVAVVNLADTAKCNFDDPDELQLLANTVLDDAPGRA